MKRIEEAHKTDGPCVQRQSRHGRQAPTQAQSTKRAHSQYYTREPQSRPQPSFWRLSVVFQSSFSFVFRYGRSFLSTCFFSSFIRFLLSFACLDVILYLIVSTSLRGSFLHCFSQSVAPSICSTARPRPRCDPPSLTCL